LDKKNRNLIKWDIFTLLLIIACNGQKGMTKMWQKYGIEILNYNRQNYRVTKMILTFNFNSNWLFLTPNLSYFFFLKSLNKKHVFRTFWDYLEGGTVNSTKGCARVYHYKMQYITQIIQKRRHHISNLWFATLWVKGTLNINSLNLRRQKKQEPSKREWF
jgi:hypothetical protein